jgi:hypothetical protein
MSSTVNGLGGAAGFVAGAEFLFAVKFALATDAAGNSGNSGFLSVSINFRASMA